MQMLSVSPSKIARYFYHECERYLFFNAVLKDEREMQGIPDWIFDVNPVTAAIMEGGVTWEEKVIDEIIKDDVSIAPSHEEKRASERHFSYQDTIKALGSVSKKYIYQPTFIIPDRFYEKYGIDKEKVHFANCRPDLISCEKYEDEVIFRIIDVKSSDALKISHKVQVTVYALMLSQILEENNIKGRADTALGGIWLYGEKEPLWFNMELIVPHVEQFLSQLNNIAEKRAGEMFWQFDYRCEWCDFYDYCLQKARDESHISLLPYMSHYAARYIRDNEIPATINDMSDFIEKKENRDKLSKCTSLKHRLTRLKPQLDSISQNRMISYGSRTADMPVGENIRIILTAQRDQVSGRIFSAAVSRSGGSDVFGEGRDIKTFTAKTPEETDDIIREFISYLYMMLYKVHQYNMVRDWKEQKSVQAYVTDNYEWENIQGMLQELLADKDYAVMAVDLLFHFQCELLAEAEDHPEGYCPFPVIVLTSVVSRMFALPAHVAYRLHDLTSNLTPDDGKPYVYNPSEDFSFKLSNVMKSDIIQRVWSHNEFDKIECIEKELCKRIYAADSVIRGIRNKARDESGNSLLFAWPEKFSYPQAMKFKNPLLSKLSFMVRYESVLRYLEVRSARTLPREEREEAGITLSLTYIDRDLFKVNNKEAALELEEDSPWLLTEDNPRGELSHMSFYDFSYKDKMFAPAKSNLYYARVARIHDIEGDYIIKLDISKAKGKFQLEKGEKYLLSMRFTDWTGNRVTKTLASLDEEGGAILDLLSDPAGALREYEDFDISGREYNEVIERHKFTKSQEKAFRHFINKSLTLVWGPPGTGKTHFVAMALLSIAELSKRIGKPLKILVAAFTHAAIENCLLKIEELKGSSEVKVLKYGGITTDKARSIAETDDNEIGEYMNDESSSIIGATLYRIQKAYEKGNIERDFDIVVLDEASQVRVPDSLLALNHTGSNGRMLIVGDHYQLPPIIKGKYEAEDCEPSLYSSIFKLFYDYDADKVYTHQLSENFRMNSTLCRYPAKMIYGSSYVPFNDEIAGRRIHLLNTSSEDWVSDILDPEYSLIVCVSEGILEGQENETEAKWVANIAKELRQSLLSKDMVPYDEDLRDSARFWREGLFIISPHHAQIRAIRKCLESEGIDKMSFVDTVDKMQGQESDVAIISYGVSDPELAANEGEFIYSLNRLNVSITRARCKTIIFLSRHLLSPTLQVLANDEYAEGVRFMLGLEKYAERHGDKKVYDMDGVRLNIYRAK